MFVLIHSPLTDEPSIADQLQSLHQALRLDTRSYNYSYHRKSDPSFQYLLSAQKLIDTFDLGDYNTAMKECSRCRILFNKAEKRLDDANAKRVGSISVSTYVYIHMHRYIFGFDFCMEFIIFLL